MFRRDVVLRGMVGRVRVSGAAQVTFENASPITPQSKLQDAPQSALQGAPQGAPQIIPLSAQCDFNDGHAEIESEAHRFLRRLHRHERARDLGHAVERGVVLRVSV